MSRNQGFTVVELLVSIVIIGILAGLTFVGWTGYRDRAKTATLISDVTNASRIIEAEYSLSNSIAYPTSASSVNGGKGLLASSGNTLTYTYNNNLLPAAYCVSVTNGDKSYRVTSINKNAEVGYCGNSGIVTTGLILNLDASEPTSYSNTGTTWYDLSGSAYNGILQNSPSYNSSNPSSLSLNGSNSFIDGAVFTPNVTSKTLSGWVKLSSVTQQGGGLINIQSTDGVTFDAIVYNETNNGWGFGSNGFTRTGWSGVKETSTSAWVNIVATYENLNYKLYRNGSLIYTLTSFNALSFNFPSKNLVGQRHTGGGSAFLAGNIGQVLMYSRALTESEVLQNYNGVKARYGL